MRHCRRVAPCAACGRVPLGGSACIVFPRPSNLKGASRRLRRWPTATLDLGASAREEQALRGRPVACPGGGASATTKGQKYPPTRLVCAQTSRADPPQLECSGPVIELPNGHSSSNFAALKVATDRQLVSEGPRVVSVAAGTCQPSGLIRRPISLLQAGLLTGKPPAHTLVQVIRSEAGPAANEDRPHLWTGGSTYER